MNPPRRCTEEGCPRWAAPRVQRCDWHQLARQAPVVRVSAAEHRLSLVPMELRKGKVPKKEWPDGHRWCSGCQTFVPMEFIRGSRCRDCTSIASHLTRIKSEFGLDAASYQWLLEKQLGRCAICRQRPVSKRLAVDHDHHTGRVRGLLCSTCNNELLVAARHSVDILTNAVRYLTTPPFDAEWTAPDNELEEWRVTYGDGPPAPY